MLDPVADVTLDRALEILEIGQQDLEQLLVNGDLRGYRRGNDIIFRREDLANYITSGSSSAAPPAPGPSAPSKPRESARVKRDSRRESMDSLKKAAMSNGGGKEEGMWSLKKLAVERGLVEGGEAAAEAGPTAPAGAGER